MINRNGIEKGDKRRNMRVKNGRKEKENDGIMIMNNGRKRERK